MSGLCIDCNLCCDGSLFARVPVRAQDRARLPEIAGLLRQGGEEGALRMPLPCACLGAEGRCNVYARRPQACRAYRCGLVKALEAGEIDEGTARQTLRRIRRLQSEAIDLACRAIGTTPDPGTTWAVARAALEAAQAAGGQINGFAAARARLRHRAFAALVSEHVKPGFTTRSGSQS